MVDYMSNPSKESAMMKKFVIVAIMSGLVLPFSLNGADRKTTDDSKTQPAVKTIPAATTQKSAQPSAVAPTAGEQIKWQVISGGGGRGTSTSYILNGTLGQTAAGPGTSASYKINQGYWQNFGSGSCCVGKRGNVNMVGGIDLSDLSALVSYLTGGSFVPPCTDAANVNGAGGVDLSDLSSLVSYLTGGSFVLVDCP